VVAPLSGHTSALIRDTLAALLIDHDLFLMDWVDARDVAVADGQFSLEDNITYVIEALRVLGGDSHLLGLCQSAIPVLAATAILAEAHDRVQPRSMVLISGAIDPRINSTRIGRLAARGSIDWFERYAITVAAEPYAGRGRHVYPAAAQRSALTAYFMRHLATRGELWQKWVDDDGQDPARFPFFAGFFSLMDLTAEFFIDTLKFVFQDFALPSGALLWRGSQVDLAAIRQTALMTIEGEFDDVSGLGQTRIAHALCPNIPMARRCHHLQHGVGHFGTFHGEPWRAEIMPQIRQFIQRAG